MARAELAAPLTLPRAHARSLPLPAGERDWNADMLNFHSPLLSLSPAGRGKGPAGAASAAQVGRVRGSLTQRDQDHLQHTIRIGQHIRIPEADDAISLLFEKPCTPGVNRIVRMLTAVDLDHKHSLRAEKVRNVRPNRNLAPELEAAKRPVAQARPEARFRSCLHDAQMARAGNILALHVTPPSPFPPSAGPFPLPDGERELVAHSTLDSGNR